MKLFTIDETAIIDVGTKDIDDVYNPAELTIKRDGKNYVVCKDHYELETFRRFEDAQVYINSHGMDVIHEFLCSRYHVDNGDGDAA